MKMLILAVLSMLLASCGIQSIPQAKNDVEAKLAQTTNQYKRRADLVPGLVNIVKGYAAHEKEALESVTKLRTQATQVTIDVSKLDPAQIKKFQKVQSELSQSLGRLLAISENYPDLKANQNFRDLQVQLEGTENRIAVARKNYIQSIQHFNNLVTVFPTSLTNQYFFGFEKMPQWDVADSENVEQAPEIKF